MIRPGKFCIILIVWLVVSCASPQKQVYEWKHSFMGGGGFITGLVVDPVDTAILYARCDVGGMYKSVDGGKSWNSINNNMTACHHQSVESFAMNSFNHNLLLRGSGEARNHQLFGDIHKSTDGGKTWKIVCNQVDFMGNGPNRMRGEKIAFDPFDSTFVAAFGYSSGIYRSVDIGETWSYAQLKGEPAGCLCFHPYKKGVIYAGTLQEMEHSDYIYPDSKYSRPKLGRLYRSDDQAKTWKLICESDQISFFDLAFDSKNPDMIYVSSHNGLFISHDKGKSFVRANVGLPENIECSSASTHRALPGTVFASFTRFPEHKDLPVIPIYRSDNYGKDWYLLADCKKEDLTQYPAYFESMDWAGYAIAKVKLNPANPQTMYFSNWYGVSASADGGKSWSGHYFKGVENVCINNIISDPMVKHKFWYVLADHFPFFSTDTGKVFHKIPKIEIPKNLNSCTAIAISKHKSGCLLYGVNRWEKPSIGSGIIQSFDNGNNPKVVKIFDNGLYVQALTEDPFHAGVFFAYIDGALSLGSGVYKSDDYGSTWNKVNLQLPSYIHTLPHRKNWIESELLPVVFDQPKNVCGANQLLCADTHHENTFYLGEWTEGIFKTNDGGSSWTDISGNLPFKTDSVNTLVDIKCDPKRANIIYAGFIKAGLWVSENGGRNWSKLYPKNDEPFNASSMVIGGVTADEIYVACEPLYYSPCHSSIIFSTDRGKTFTDVFDHTLGAVRWKGIAVDDITGTIVGVSCGSGCFYAERSN